MQHMLRADQVSITKSPFRPARKFLMKLSREGMPKWGIRSISLRNPLSDDRFGGAALVIIPLNKPAARGFVSSSDTVSREFSIYGQVS